MESWSISSFAAVWDKVERGELKVLQPDFYGRDTVTVARELLGKVLVVRERSSLAAIRITETEAYHGTGLGADPAAHCARGETPRCSIMFGDPGFAYVYFIYGMYEMLNFVTERKGYPGAVLIRAGEPLAGIEVMKRRRPRAKPGRLASGPGVLCRALDIRLSHKGQALWGPKLYVIDDGYEPESIHVSKRVGIKVGQDRPWRFFIAGHPSVSQA